MVFILNTYDNYFFGKNIKYWVDSKFYIISFENNITTEVKTFKNLQFRDLHQNLFLLLLTDF
jgi:hypothetical protein